MPYLIPGKAFKFTNRAFSWHLNFMINNGVISFAFYTFQKKFEFKITLPSFWTVRTLSISIFLILSYSSCENYVNCFLLKNFIKKCAVENFARIINYQINNDRYLFWKKALYCSINSINTHEVRLRNNVGKFTKAFETL